MDRCRGTLLRPLSTSVHGPLGQHIPATYSWATLRCNSPRRNDGKHLGIELVREFGIAQTFEYSGVVRSPWFFCLCVEFWGVRYLKSRYRLRQAQAVLPCPIAVLTHLGTRFVGCSDERRMCVCVCCGAVSQGSGGPWFEL